MKPPKRLIFWTSLIAFNLLLIELISYGVLAFKKRDSGSEYLPVISKSLIRNLETNIHVLLDGSRASISHSRKLGWTYKPSTEKKLYKINIKIAYLFIA